MGINKLELVRGFNGFVRSRNWDIFLTVTFRRPMKSITVMQGNRQEEVRVWLDDKVNARKEFQYFFSHLNYAVSFFDKYMLALVCFERAYPGARLHIHALIQGISTQFCLMLQSECYEFFGESKVVPYDSSKAASSYFGWKYIKPELADFDLLKINARRRKTKKRGFCGEI